MNDEPYDVDVRIEGDWLKGKTVDPKRGTTSPWMKLTEESYLKTFWFLDSPKEYFEKYFNFKIDDNTSDSIKNTLDAKWIDFCYACSRFEKEKIGTIIKILLGPINANSLDLFSVMRNPNFIKVVNEDIGDKQKMDIFTDIFVNDILFEDSLSRNSFTNISEEKMMKALEEVISSNAEQWKKALINPKLGNWFIGQMMKKFQGKVDAEIVKSLIEKRMK